MATLTIENERPVAHSLSEDQLQEHRDMIDEATGHMRSFRDTMLGKRDVSPVPKPSPGQLGRAANASSGDGMSGGIPEGTLTGGCQCGAVRYAISGDRRQLYVCHCRECQKQSASAFGISLGVTRAGLRVTRGAPKFWSRANRQGHTLRCAFCPDCGSRLWHEGDCAAISIKG